MKNNRGFLMKDTAVLKWIYEKSKKNNIRIVLLTLMNVGSAICATMFALLSKTVMDCAQKGNRDELLKSVIYLMSVILLQILLRIVSSFLEAVTQGKAEIDLRSAVFSDVLHGEYAKVTGNHSGDLMTRLTADVQIVSTNYIHLLPSTISHIVRLVSVAVALYVLDKNFSIIIVSCGITIPIVAMIFRKYMKILHRRVQEKNAKVRSFMQEMIENLFAVKVFAIEEKVKNISLKQQQSFYKETVKKKSLSILAGISFSLAFAIGFLFAVAYGSYGVLNGTMTFGTVIAIIQLVNQLRTPAVGVTRVFPMLFGMISSAQRLIEITNYEKEKLSDTEIDYEDFVRISVKNASFGYNDETVLESADFTVEKGEFVGIKGPSGAGKSTVFKLITGLYSLNSGSAVVETSKGDVECKDARRLFSFVPQDNMLFSGTVRENITMLNPDATEAEIETALKNAAAEFAFELENGLDFVLGESGMGVSQGQAQRLAIARALLGKGKILLMDEATSALDSDTERRIMENLRNAGDVTVLFITHREMVVEQCDRTITVQNKHISEN